MVVFNRGLSSLSLTVALLIVTSVTVSLAINGQDQRPLLHDLLEKALTGNSSNLFEVQRVYFDPAGSSPEIIYLLASVTVGNIISNATQVDSDCPAFNCSHESSQCHSSYFNFTLSPYSNEDNSTLQISDLVGPEGYDVLTLLDPTLYILTSTLAIPQWLSGLFGNKSDSERYDREIKLDLYINELESMPEYGELCDALSMLLVWVRSNSMYYIPPMALIV